MNKCVLVLGVAAVATLAGCKDPDYKYANQASSQEAVKIAEPTPVEPAPSAPIAVETVPVAKCTCPPGTKHETPCACAAPDCRCVVEPKKVVQPEPKATTYVVKSGDSLSKISKKFNIRLAALRAANPKLKGDLIRIGQKLSIPAVAEGGAKVAPARQAVKHGAVKDAKAVKGGKDAKSAKAKKPYAPYTGATKEYVVKNGDTLGSIAYSNGLSIRQLKELNGLVKNDLKVGQKLKVPETAPVKLSAKEPTVKPVGNAVENPAEKPVDAVAPVVPAENPVEAAPAVPAEKPVETTAAPKPAEPPTTDYVVQEGDDITGISIRFATSASSIRELNNLAEDAQIAPGTVLKIPAENQQ